MASIALWMAMVLFVAAPAAPGVDDELRRARNEYAYGNYEVAADLLRSLLVPMRLSTDAQVIEARRTLALSCYLLDKECEAREEFAKLLYLNPDYELDPFTVAPPVIELFESVRNALVAELDVIRQRQNTSKEAPTQTSPVVERRRIEHSPLVSYLPFGAGQMQNGDVKWAAVFGITEATLLAVNVGSYLGALSLQHYPPEKRATVQALTVVQYVSLALLGTVWGVGVLHARLHFVPLTDAPMTAQPASGNELGMGLAVNF